MVRNFESYVPVDILKKYYDATDHDPVDIEITNGEAKIVVQVKPLLDMNTFASVVQSVADICLQVYCLGARYSLYACRIIRIYKFNYAG